MGKGERLETRRSFLKAAAGTSVLAPFIRRMPITSAAAVDFDPDFGTASQAVRAIRSGVISARELTEHVYTRIRKHNPAINAFITLIEEQAMARAGQADEALAAGKTWGALHGIPIVVKDTFETAGVRTTSGSKLLENHVPGQDAIAVDRLKSAGAIILGKTNLPEFASDLQSYNEVAGTTNNPWDVSRTPGGSTGGGAAALASGMGFLELGSDIGGSIRTPAHFCGVYGHKPSLEIVPMQGHIPPPSGTITLPADLAVAGPLARSAQDLMLELEIVGGPPSLEAVTYRWSLPSPRGSRLKDYRIGYVLDDPFCPVTPEVKEVLAGAVDALGKAGVELTQGWPEGVNPQAAFDAYLPLLAAWIVLSDEEIELMRQSLDSPWQYYARNWLEGYESSHRRWMERSQERLKARQIWQDYFKTHDAFLMPENFVPAFPHAHNLTFFERTVSTSQGERQYGDMLRWIVVPTLTGCPATVAPAGRTRAGLPVGIQIMGPYLEDATPIHFAGALADLIGGFEPPPGFGS